VRIGVLTTSYPRAPGDFAGAWVADRVRALAAEGHQVDVIAAGAAADAQAATTIETGETTASVTVARLPARLCDGPDLFAGAGAPEVLEQGGLRAWWGAARFSAGLVAAVAARASSSRWARIESHWLAPCGLAAAAAAPGVPHRAIAHSGDVALLERVPLGSALARHLVRSGAELVFVSEALRRRFGALVGALHGVVDPSAVAGALFAPSARPDLRLRAALGLGCPTVVSVGRLVPIKGLDLLVRACAARPEDAAPIQLVVVGEGPERERLHCLAQRLGVSLRLTGAVSRDDVSTWLRAADLYAQPSRVLASGRTEGLPVATLEALSTGLPAVVSDSGGLAELPGRGWGSAVRVVRAGDVAALGHALRQGLAAPRLVTSV
jgi:glycosyltransferase involved in cell wall biosynthesis